jgi:hypothetical protein
LKYLLLIIISFFVSCQYFEKNIPNPEILAEEKLKTIDFSEVTSYPSTDICDTLTNNLAKKDCFFQYISQLIQAKFDEQESTVYTRDRDTINVYVTVDYTGKINIKTKDSVLDKTMFDSIFAIQSSELPKINPATKAGIPVSIQFEVPILLKLTK